MSPLQASFRSKCACSPSDVLFRVQLFRVQVMQVGRLALLILMAGNALLVPAGVYSTITHLGITLFNVLADDYTSILWEDVKVDSLCSHCSRKGVMQLSLSAARIANVVTNKAYQLTGLPTHCMMAHKVFVWLLPDMMAACGL
jgi:hypothetical protein